MVLLLREDQISMFIYRWAVSYRNKLFVNLCKGLIYDECPLWLYLISIYVRKIILTRESALKRSLSVYCWRNDLIFTLVSLSGLTALLKKC